VFRSRCTVCEKLQAIHVRYFFEFIPKATMVDVILGRRIIIIFKMSVIFKMNVDIVMEVGMTRMKEIFSLTLW